MMHWQISIQSLQGGTVLDQICTHLDSMEPRTHHCSRCCIASSGNCIVALCSSSHGLMPGYAKQIDATVGNEAITHKIRRYLLIHIPKCIRANWSGKTLLSGSCD